MEIYVESLPAPATVQLHSTFDSISAQQMIAD